MKQFFLHIGLLYICRWVDYGTLLGTVRGGDVIHHDYDVDFSRLVMNPEDGKAQMRFKNRFSHEMKRLNCGG